MGPISLHLHKLDVTNHTTFTSFAMTDADFQLHTTWQTIMSISLNYSFYIKDCDHEKVRQKKGIIEITAKEGLYFLKVLESFLAS